jgi:hypothetical protein
MKLTKSELRQIIQEELDSIVGEEIKTEDAGDDEETNESQDQLYQMVQEELEAVIAERIKQ